MNKTRLIIISIIVGGVVLAALVGVSVYSFLESDRVISKPTSLTLYPPSNSNDVLHQFDTVKNPLVLKVLLYENDGIYAYQNLELYNGRRFSYDEFRSHLKDLKQRDSNLVVLIKPGVTSSYSNSVNMLDEMSISDIRKYAMIDHNKLEEKFIDSLLK